MMDCNTTIKNHVVSRGVIIVIRKCSWHIKGEKRQDPKQYVEGIYQNVNSEFLWVMGLWVFFSLCFSVFPKIAGLSMLLFKMRGHFFLMNVLLIVILNKYWLTAGDTWESTVTWVHIKNTQHTLHVLVKT